MTFFNNPHRGYTVANNQSNQSLIQVGPNLYQDTRTGAFYINTPQGLMPYNQNPQFNQPYQPYTPYPQMPNQQFTQFPQQPMRIPIQTDNQPMFPNQSPFYPNMQPGAQPFMQPNMQVNTQSFMQPNQPTNFNNSFISNQNTPSFNPRYNNTNLIMESNQAKSRYDNYTSSDNTFNNNQNAQFGEIPQGSNVGENQMKQINFSEVDPRFFHISPFASRVKEDNIVIEEIDVNHIFYHPSEIIGVSLEDVKRENDFNRSTIKVINDARIGREYFIFNEGDRKLIKHVFSGEESIKTFINDFIYALNNSNSAESVAFLTDYNKFLTNKVNNILKGINKAKIRIDSFIDDYFDLANIIETQFGNIEINDKIIEEVYNASLITKEIMEENDNFATFAMVDKKTIVIIPDVIEIYTKYYDEIRGNSDFVYEVNQKEDNKLYKLITVVVNKLKSEFEDVDTSDFILGFINCKYLNVKIDEKNKKIFVS
jgi:hypothetical protein